MLSAPELLHAELARLDLMLQRRIAELRQRGVFTDDPMRGLFIADEQADRLLLPAATPSPHDELSGRVAAMRAEIDSRAAAAQRSGQPSPLHALAARFGLDAFERDCLLIAAAPELDARYATLYAYAHNDVTRKRASVELCLALTHTPMSAAVRARFAPTAAWRHWELLAVESEAGKPLLDATLWAPDSVLAQLLGAAPAAALDAWAGLAPPSEAASALLPGERFVQTLRHAQDWLRDTPAVVQLIGPRGIGKRLLAQRLASARGLGLAVLDLRTPGHDAPQQVARFIRDATLAGAAPCLAGLHLAREQPAWAAWSAMLRSTLRRAQCELRLPVFLTAYDDPELELDGVSNFLLKIPETGLEERAACWRRHAGSSETEAAELAGSFRLAPAQIAAASVDARHLARLRSGQGTLPSGADWRAAATARSARGLARLAQRVSMQHSFDDLVLPARTLAQLRAVLASVRRRSQVHSDWGFAARLGLSDGMNVLFAGASGTGKTMSAQVLAATLGLSLYKIDLSCVVSKYIGDTEKNLSAIFNAARCANAMLFFDEADALFGKRSEVKDAHDRHANVEVAYLLQKMEEHPGIVVLATNLAHNIDDAFARRMAHVIDFPTPDAALREQLWRQMLPPAAPLDASVDLGFLAARFELAGGHIRNIALAAAFLAAEAGHAITMGDLVISAARELHKLGRLPGRSDFGHYYDLVRDAV
jgi:ATPase family associated with various cellular activities (AAA)